MKNRLFYLLKSQRGFSSLRDVGLSGFSSTGKNAIDRSITEPFKRVVVGSSPVSKLTPGANTLWKDIPKLDGRQIRDNRVSLLSSYQFGKRFNVHSMQPFLTRSLASSSAPQSSRKPQEQRTDISAYEDPFDAPTSNIPEKPVTFVEGASYSVAILAGLGLASLVAYTAFNEFVITPPEQKVFGKALKRIQNESKVKDIIGSPIKGYGIESRNRNHRRQIPHKIWKDEDGVQHVLVQFVIRGPQGTGDVECKMFKDSSDGQWKYTSLLVQTNNSSSRRPSPILVLESYIPPAKFSVK